MLKSIGVVVGSYLLSVILVLATDPLLSRLFPGDFVKGSVPSDSCSRREYGVLRGHLDALRVALRPLCSGPRRAPCALVFYYRGGDGHRRDNSQLEQRLAALVLVVLAADLAGELLDRLAACRTPRGFRARLGRDLTCAEKNHFGGRLEENAKNARQRFRPVSPTNGETRRGKVLFRGLNSRVTRPGKHFPAPWAALCGIRRLWRTPTCSTRRC